ncbi:MAG: hypothetical protein K9N46_16025 [Candidatus Marinimicrobia bacterium]|nr:hypothetical protein [Candidatus Neomarinimicrobiota bacterium]MCF7829584.1 hypothetical protein [Candidatus Neomarinimicrobiota bacterium]MCF7882238.1 hypothetical protein [Candidatus Neomarinimicrobiota bacterium]
MGNARLSQYLMVSSILCVGLLAGCSGVPVPSDFMPAVIQGQIISTSEGGVSHSGVAEVEIVLLRYDAQGNIHRGEADRILTARDGTFRVKTNSTGISGLVVWGEKNGRDWKTVIPVTLEPGTIHTTGPITKQTTIATDIYLKRKYGGQSAVTFAQVLENIRTEAEVAPVIPETVRDLTLAGIPDNSREARATEPAAKSDVTSNVQHSNMQQDMDEIRQLADQYSGEPQETSPIRNLNDDTIDITTIPETMTLVTANQR